MSNVIPFPTTHVRDGPDPELGEAILAAAQAIESQPRNSRAQRRLARLLSPGISEFHADLIELSIIFARIREGGDLDEPQRHTLIRTARAEAAFLITGKV